MKIIDKFLKFLHTDRNTFATYIFTLLSLYFVVDRFVEVMFMCFTGVSVAYWGPIQYTFALACPIFAFLFCYSSQFVKSSKLKLTFLYVYCTALYIIAISMLVQWINQLGWLFLVSVPNYVDIVTNFSELIKPAFICLAFYIPLMTWWPLINWMTGKVQDTKDLRDSVYYDYSGISLANKKEGTGPYTCEIAVCKDEMGGKMVVVPESKRFESMLIVGPSGTGKTSMVFEPMIARDIEKKYFYHEMSKEMGFTALKMGLATLTYPYSNEYLNKNFTLSMLRPNPAKFDLYKAYMKKMILSESGIEHIIYRSIGITTMSPDYETIGHMLEVAKNYNVDVNLIDPNNADSIGLNPFIIDEPADVAIAISSVLKGMYSTTHVAVREAFRENVATQAVENLSILLKEIYPMQHDGDLPTIEDMLHLLNNFDLVENLCEDLKQEPDLKDKYALQIGYFQKNFYKDSPGRRETEEFVHSAITQFDILLRYPGVKSILCNRTHNIDFNKALNEGQITMVCTRRGDLGATATKAFGLFFLLLMGYFVTKRPGIEKTRLPHFLYVDEFADFICPATDDIFTVYRKYRVGTVISTQNIAQLAGDENDEKCKQTIISNCITKLAFGNASPEETNWWEEEFGNKREWKFTLDYDTESTDKKERGYNKTYKAISWAWKPNFEKGKIQGLVFKQCIYKVKDKKGKTVVGYGAVDFLTSKYKEKQPIKNYNFEKFTNGIIEEPKISRRGKIKLEEDNFNSDIAKDEEINPILTDNSDVNLFDNDDAIIFDLKKGNPNG